MFKKCSLALLALALLLAPIVGADQQGNPTVAFLTMNPNPAFAEVQKGVLDSLTAYGFIDAEERATLEIGQAFEGENISLIWGESDSDFASVNLVVENVLDQQPDVLIPLTTPVTQIAINATLDLDQPPAVLFAFVYNPYEAGIARSSCIKPDHVTGAESIISYEDVLSLLVMQDPDLDTVGVLYDSAGMVGAIGAARIAAIGAEMGLSVEQAAVTSFADLRLATEGLFSKGVDALVLPPDVTVSHGLPVVVTVANENNKPIFHASFGSFIVGATVSTGFYRYYKQGADVGSVLVAHLNGDIDIAATAINLSASSRVGVNADAAAAQGVEIVDELMEQAYWVMEEGQIAFGPTIGQASVDAYFADYAELDLEARMAADAELLASLQCSPEMIAEQQAALDAAE